MHNSGTPINRAPILGGKDIDLYKLYRVVQHYGGGKKVTQNQQWKKVGGLIADSEKYDNLREVFSK